LTPELKNYLCQNLKRPLPNERWLWISIKEQKLRLLDHDKILQDWPMSSAKAGVGCQEGSHQSPDGWHEIAEKIGALEHLGQIFESRKALNKIWDPNNKNEKDLILTRILWLRGLEKGHNSGFGIDSYQRYIYIHGTNHEELLSKAQSSGCFRLGNKAISSLFDEVEESVKVLVSRY
jgi:hypothetical protein